MDPLVNVLCHLFSLLKYIYKRNIYYQICVCVCVCKGRVCVKFQMWLLTSVKLLASEFNTAGTLALEAVVCVGLN